MSHSISLADAAAMTARYRSYREQILNSQYQGQNVLPLCETFQKASILSIAGQEGCTAVRIYYGMDEGYKVHAIIVGVNADDADMLPATGLSATEDDTLIEHSFRCPDICPPDSELNS